MKRATFLVPGRLKNLAYLRQFSFAILDRKWRPLIEQAWRMVASKRVIATYEKSHSIKQT